MPDLASVLAVAPGAMFGTIHGSGAAFIFCWETFMPWLQHIQMLGYVGFGIDSGSADQRYCSGEYKLYQ